MALEAYPVDSMGMPLAVVIAQDPKLGEAPWNKHHAWFYARRFLWPQLGATPGSRAVRGTRKQRVLEADHNDLHDAYEAGLEPPQNEHEEAKQVLFNLAGRVTDEGVLVKNGSLSIIEIDPYRKSLLRKNGIFGIEKDAKELARIGGFLLDYVVKNGLPQLMSSQESLIEQYAESIDEERDRLLKVTIRAAAAIALSPWEDLYSTERRNNSLRERACWHPEDVFRLPIFGFVPDLDAAFQKTVVSHDIEMPLAKVPVIVD